MSSTFLGLNTAYTGLLAANAALNTTANNIANSETKGYSRQEVNQEAAEAIRMFTTYGCVGAGVDVISIERIRDGFYDKKYWENEAKFGEQSTRQYYYKQLEIYFSDDGIQVQGFNTVFNKMYDALDEVRKTPDDSTTKEQFITYASGFTQYFNNLHNQLKEMQDSCNEEIKIMVDKVTSIAEQLSVLNQRINSIEVGSKNQKANELRDQREKLIDELSSIVSVEVLEVPILNQFGEQTNTTRYTVKICGGQTLVDNEMYRTLSCVAREDYENVNQSDIQGLYDVYWDYDEKNFNSDKFNLASSSVGGKLAGLIAMRDGNNAEYFHGDIKDVHKVMYRTGDYDEKGDPYIEQRTAIKIEVTEDYLVDLNKTNLAEKGVINVAYKDYHYDGFTFMKEQDSTGEMHYYYEIVMAREDTMDRSVVNKQAVVGGKVEYQGIPYYQQQMTEWIRTYSESFNNILTDHSVDDYGHSGVNLFVADAKIDDEQFNFFGYEEKAEAYAYLTWKTSHANWIVQENAYRSKTGTVPKWFGDMIDQFDLTGTITSPVEAQLTPEEYAERKKAYDFLKEEAEFSKKLVAFDKQYDKQLNVQKKEKADIEFKDSDGNKVEDYQWYADMLSQYYEDGKIVLSINNLDNSYYKLTAGTFNVANYMKHDPQLLATHTKDFDVTSTAAYDTIERLQNLKTDKSMMTFRGGSASEFLQNILADVSLNSNSAITFAGKFESMKSLITNQRLSISGVDNDEEAANLVKFQTAYNLSSKMVQTLTEVYDRLILETGV